MRDVANGAFLTIMGAIAALFLGGMEGGHIVLARHYDNTQVFKNSHINVQTDTDQRQGCETAGGTSPILDSCTATSTNTISQGAVPPSPCTATSYPTVLTLSVSPTSVRGFEQDLVISTGTLTDTCTGSGVTGATIAGIVTDATGVVVGEFTGVTDATGTYSVQGFKAPLPTGTNTVQAHFTGQGIFGPSNSQTQTLTVS